MVNQIFAVNGPGRGYLSFIMDVGKPTPESPQPLNPEVQQLLRQRSIEALALGVGHAYADTLAEVISDLEGTGEDTTDYHRARAAEAPFAVDRITDVSFDGELEKVESYTLVKVDSVFGKMLPGSYAAIVDITEDSTLDWHNNHFTIEQIDFLIELHKEQAQHGWQP